MFIFSMEEKEELICNFERYRLLIMNEFKDISEKAVLKNISEKEFWLTGQTEDLRKHELEKKRYGPSIIFIHFMQKSSGQQGVDRIYLWWFGDRQREEWTRKQFGRGNAGGRYRYSWFPTKASQYNLDIDLERYLIGQDSQSRCNKIGEGFGIRDAHFCALFKADQQAQRTSAEIRRIDRQKASLVVSCRCCWSEIIEFRDERRRITDGCWRRRGQFW